MGITAPEYWEYQKRKAGAQGEEAAGIILLIFSIVLGVVGVFIFNGLLIVLAVILFIASLVMLKDADEKLRKIRHIYWTKQALREYEESKYKVLEGVERVAYPSIYEEPTLLDRLFGMVGLKPVATQGEGAPIEVQVIPEDNSTPQKERFSRLLEKLDERLVNGEISEATYKELKSKYLKKLKQEKKR